MIDAKTAATRAAQFFRENPHQHITGELAQTADRQPTSTLDPEATCWCFLGRMAVEARIDAMCMADVAQPLGFPTRYNDVWHTNDSQHMSLENRLRRIEAMFA